ncbi:hypothetical protein [Hyphomicrobium sp. MC1]|uniref:hypothetical protein n=1 Tax=Hyphomicrobium sp. (strain MC1) TaxID=717785 RepID=UPI000213DAB9|nr:hypothetical protein [Hyphomicrobium sp. MC1]CCB64478.1 conserved protein of unknown function [Hyphomicrobium sp. MC1]
MANYYAPISQFRTGPGVNFEPVNQALDVIIQQQNQNRQFGFQQKASDRADQQLAFEQQQAKQATQRQRVADFGKQATAVDQLTDPTQRAAAWQSIIRSHGTQGLSPEELDPVTGPKLMAAQAGMYLDPRDSQAKDLELQKTRAEIGKLNAQAANGGSEYGKAGTIVQDSNRRFYSVQFGANGQPKVKPLEFGGAPGTQPGQPGAPPVALTPSRGVAVQGDLMYDKATGGSVRNVGTNVAAGKSALVQGEAQGKAAANLPLAENAASRVLGAIGGLLANRRGLDRVTGTVYGRLPEVTNTSNEAKNAQASIDFINSNTFLQAYNDLRGAGAITEKEGEAAQAAYNKLRSQQLGTDDYIKAVQDYRDQVISLLNIARARAQGGNVVGVSQGQPAPQAPANGGWSIKRLD